MEAGLNDITKRMDQIERQMREIMQGIVFLYECMALEQRSKET
jgi:hypothetical protein